MMGGTDPRDGTTLTEATTAIETALAILQRLGRSDQADTLIAEAEQSSAYAALDADRDHNEDWKRTQYARKYTSVMAGLARQLTAAANRVGKQDSDDAASVYGIAGLPGDVASLAISRRDAGDRVADITDPSKRQDLLATAVRNGDVVLAHALAESAIKAGDADTTNAFSAAYPNLASAVERLWNAEHRRMTTVDVKVSWRVAALKSAALGSLQNYEIAAAVAGQTGVGSWNIRS